MDQEQLTPQQLEEAHNKKIVAGILGILLGGLGIHKFYLGYTTAGIIMLVVSIVSCGFVAPIISIIGLIEGILYLTKSDEEFYRRRTAVFLFTVPFRLETGPGYGYLMQSANQRERQRGKTLCYYRRR